MATSFTFDPAFFEEECLSRFLRLETNAADDGAAYLIEREEKLAEARVVALVDHRHADPMRSLRWDLLPVRVPGAALHAKVDLLVWENAVRLIVGSANLTEAGYRKNREIFGVLDFRDEAPVPISVLRDVLRFLEGILRKYVPGGDRPETPKARALGLLDRTRGMFARYTPGRREPVEVEAVFTGSLPKVRHSAMEWLRSRVPVNQRPDAALVVSPFFDVENPVALEELKACLLQRGEREIAVVTDGEKLEDRRVRLHLPAWMRDAGSDPLSLSFHRVETDEEGSGAGEFRPLHAKLIRLDRSGGYSIALIGSSNFTRAGLGLGDGPVNLEANLGYVARDPRSAAELRRIAPRMSERYKAGEIVFDPAKDDGEADAADAPLPTFFEEALFAPGAENGRLHLVLRGEPAAEWIVRSADGATILTEESWRGLGARSEVDLDWASLRPPTFLEVAWSAEGRRWAAKWVVNVTEPALLPPPEELRNLPLRTLLEILTSARPVHETLRRAVRERTRSASGANDPHLDPLRRFHDRAALLYRTRAVARALDRLRERLERPVLHEDALIWRLEGPLGPICLAEALCREARTQAEGAFLVAEVALTVAAVRLEPKVARLDSERVRRSVARCIERLRERADTLSGAIEDPSLRQYVAAALGKAGA
jgi:hypothetical protein